MAFWSRWRTQAKKPVAPPPIPQSEVVENDAVCRPLIDFTSSEYEEVITSLKKLDLRQSTKADRHVASRLMRAARNGGVGLPALPQSVARLRQVMDDPDADAAAVAQALKTEPAVAAHIFGVANSPIYGTSPAAGLEGAVMRLGFLRVRGLVTAVISRSKLFRVRSQAELAHQIYDAALGTAAVAEMLSKSVPAVNSEMAFSAGLFHDLGRLFVLSIADQVEGEGIPAATGAFIDQASDATDAPFSALLARSWGYEESLVQALRGHNVVKADDAISFLDEDEPACLTFVLAGAEVIVKLLNAQRAGADEGEVDRLRLLASHLLASLDIELSDELVKAAGEQVDALQKELSSNSRAA